MSSLEEIFGKATAYMAQKKFGPEFHEWLTSYTTNANFYVLWSAIKGNETAEWALVLTLADAWGSSRTLQIRKNAKNQRIMEQLPDW